MASIILDTGHWRSVSGPAEKTVCCLKFVVTQSQLESHLPGKEEEAGMAPVESDLVSTPE